MSEEMKKKKDQPQNQQQGGQVLAFSGLCLAEDCKSKAKKAGFCPEHFQWFKFGLLTKTGEKAKDFDRKIQDWERRHRAA